MALAALLGTGAASALDSTQPVGEYLVTAWTMEEGLPHNLVHAVAQDRDGYLWIGSWEGVARFNGRHFTAFDERSIPDIPLAGVRSILRDHDDAMLFGTAQHGVMRLANGVWSRLEPTAEHRLRVIALARTHEGSLWIGTDNSAWRLWPDGRLENLAEHGLPQGTVFALLDLGSDDMLIGSEHGLFRFHDGQLDEWGREHGLQGTHIRALLRRADGSVVVGGDHGAFALQDKAVARQLHAAQIESLLEDRDGTLWLGLSTGGLMRLHGGNKETIGSGMGLLGRGSQALMEDREGLLWAGTTNGLYRVSDAPAFALDSSRGLGDNYPRSILRHRDGTLYVGHAYGLDRWRDDAFEPVALGESDFSVLALAQARDGGLWLGTYDRGALHLGVDGNIQALASVEELPSRHVRALQETADGSLWIGTTNGLVRRHPDGRMEQHIDTTPGQAGSFVRGMSLARDGGLWIALADGLMRWYPDERLRRWHSETDFPAIGSFDVLETVDGAAYIATDHGLVRLRGTRFSLYDRRLGLPNDTIFRVLQDHRGALWLCSNRGVFRIEPSQLDEIDAGRRTALSVDIIDHASGMPSSQCNGGSGPAGDFDGKGRLWLPTALGVAVIDPDAVAARQRALVPVRIENLLADAQPLSPFVHHTLPASTRRVVLNYISLHLRDPLGVRYRYRMVGFDHDWVEAGTDTEAVYTNLPPGPLRFEVQAAMAPAHWDALQDLPTATLEFEQSPPYWRQAWFVVLLALTLLAAVLALLAWRSARYRRRQARLTRIIQERTHELRAKNEALLQAGRERESLLRQLAYQATHDDLTGLANRRAGEARLVEAVFSTATSDQPLCVALLDIDRFKRINDAYGHEAGDAMLRHVGKHLAQTGFIARENISRYGGEEFLLVLPGMSLDAATANLRSLVSDLARSPATLPDGHQLYCTVSIGVAQLRREDTPRSILAHADRRLYLAKERGRDRVVDKD